MSGTANGSILVERGHDGVGLVVLNRPSRLNTLDVATESAIAKAVAELDGDPAITAIVLTGSGERAFCAGQDLNEVRQSDHSVSVSWRASAIDMHLTIMNLNKPIVAAINGHALAMGFQIASVCDLRIAADNAKFGLTEVDDGVASAGGISLLWDLIGRGRATELALTGRILDASDALAWGVVARVVPRAQLIDAAIEQARSLGAKSRAVTRMNKDWIRVLLRSAYLRAKEYGEEFPIPELRV